MLSTPLEGKPRFLQMNVVFLSLSFEDVRSYEVAAVVAIRGVVFKSRWDLKHRLIVYLK